MNYIQLLLILFTIFSSLLSSDIYLNASIYLYSYLAILTFEIVKNKKITLIVIFIIAFLYMIIPEAILNFNDLYLTWGVKNVNDSFSYLVITSGLIFIGYKLYHIFHKEKNRNKTKYIEIILKKKTLLILIVLYGIFFLFINLDVVVFGLFYGRGSHYTHTYSFLFNSIAFISIGIVSYIYNNKIFKIILFTLPFLIVFFATGTRYFIVYIIFIMFFEKLYSLSLKNIVILAISAILVISMTNMIKGVRSGGIINTLQNNSVTIADENNDYNVTEYIASMGSQEGLLRNISMINDYSSKNGYTNGKSIGFITIFWVPRIIWSDKPVMLDYWLIRKYYPTQFSDGHSTASSYAGELLMDFGPILSSIILFFIGIFLSKLQFWIDENYNLSLQNNILSGVLYGWLFFGVRSILTASYMLIYFLVFSYLIFYILRKYSITNKMIVKQ